MKTEKLIIHLSKKFNKCFMLWLLLLLFLISEIESGKLPNVHKGNTTLEIQNKTESGPVILTANPQASAKLKADESTGRGILSSLFSPFGSTKYFKIGTGYNDPHPGGHEGAGSSGSGTSNKHRNDDIIYDDHHHDHHHDDPPPHHNHHGGGGIIHWPFGIKLRQYHGPGHLASGPYGPPGAAPLAHQGLNPWHNKPEDAGNGLEYEKVKLKYEVYRLKAKNRLARLQLRLERRKILSLILQYIIQMLKWWI